MPPAPPYDAQLESAVEHLHGLILADQWDGDYQSLMKIFSENDRERARQALERAHGRIMRQPKPRVTVLPEWLEGRFTLVNRIGHGGMANVFLVRDNDSGNNVALKVIHDGQHLGRFRQEASLLQEIDSSHIVKVHDWIESSNADSQGAAIVMDYVQGKDLGKMIRRREQPAEFAEVMTWMIGIGQAMIDANGKGVTHRDIKPANILIRESDNVALLVDFGLATDRNPQVKHSLSGAVLGTISYMSPEQTYGSESADARSDIYGFGATFYHVCTGMPPYVSDDPFTTVHLIRNEPLASPVTHNRKIPSEIVDILERALAKQPRDRFQTFEELKSQLEVIMTSIESLDQEPLRAVEKQAGEGSVFDEDARTTLMATSEEANAVVLGSIRASVPFHELIITSVQRGLEPGKTGFCTVASTPDIPKQVSATLGRLAGYRHLFPPQDDKAHLNPVAYSFLTGKIGRDEYRILARVADAGLDYSR
jgi:serine/threonine protein kinase